MKRYAMIILFFMVALTGCSNDSLDNRVYTQGLGISSGNGFTLTFQRFEDTNSHTVHAENFSDAVRRQESMMGGEIFTGHTELLCIDRSHTVEHMQELFYQQWIPPDCKVIFTNPEDFLQNYDCTQMVHTIRMAEENGILPLTDLSTVLNEWMGMGETALMPVPAGNLPALVLMHKDGNALRLSEEAIRGMYWLRESGKKDICFHGKEISVKVLRLKKNYKNGMLCYSLTMKISDDVPEVRDMILSDCEKAIQEMRSVNADVINIQEVMQKYHLETVPEISAEVHTITGKELLQ